LGGGSSKIYLQQTSRPFYEIETQIDHATLNLSPVIKYYLPSGRTWNKFPEIELAHSIIEKNLLVGEHANCTIARSADWDLTTGEWHESSNRQMVWDMHIALTCQDGEKTALVTIYPDGSYGKLDIKNRYK
jgi:hypothetical protein